MLYHKLVVNFNSKFDSVRIQWQFKNHNKVHWITKHAETYISKSSCTTYIYICRLSFWFWIIKIVLKCLFSPFFPYSRQQFPPGGEETSRELIRGVEHQETLWWHCLHHLLSSLQSHGVAAGLSTQRSATETVLFTFYVFSRGNQGENFQTDLWKH